MSNETNGEHFTPRDVVKLLVSLVFSENKEDLMGEGKIRSIFDPCCSEEDYWKKFSRRSKTSSIVCNIISRWEENLFHHCKYDWNRPFQFIVSIGSSRTRNYVKVYDSKLKSMFDFIEGEDKEDVKPKKDIDIKKTDEISLESKLGRLKTMRDVGILPVEVYLQHVDNLLKEYGL